MKINVLGKGFVELIDSMPRENMDLRVVECARTSFDGELYGDERDYKLLKYLIDHKELAPLEHCKMTIRVKAPLFVARQWMRYRANAYSEMSLRYTEAQEDEYYVPFQWRLQSKSNKQGSSDEQLLDTDALMLYGIYYDAIETAFDGYKSALAFGVAREQARLLLPAFALYTTFVYTTGLRNVLHFLTERLDSHAQWEMQQYAKAVLQIVRTLAPKTIEYSGLFEGV